VRNEKSPKKSKSSDKKKRKNRDGEDEKAKESYNWFYEGRNGWWQYDERASIILEDAYKTEARSCELLVSGFQYLVDFENMVQFRKSHPARRRRIKRDIVGVDRKGIAGLKQVEVVTNETRITVEKPNPVSDAEDTKSSDDNRLVVSHSDVTSGHARTSSEQIENDLVEQLNRTL